MSIPEAHSGVQIALNWNELELPVELHLPAPGRLGGTDSHGMPLPVLGKALIHFSVVCSQNSCTGISGGSWGGDDRIPEKYFPYPVLANPGRFGVSDTPECHCLVSFGCVCQLSLPIHPPLNKHQFLIAASAPASGLSTPFAFLQAFPHLP